jgi:hypothetical protein
MLQYWAGCFAERVIHNPRHILVRLIIITAASLVLLLLLVLCGRISIPYYAIINSTRFETNVSLGIDLENITRTAGQYAKDMIQSPYKSKFWELGQRSRQVAHWLAQAESLVEGSGSHRDLLAATEMAATALFPFLKFPPRNTKSKSPLADLRNSFERGSRGIVIPVGGGSQSVRFASHLIVSLRDVLGCELPIQIVYAGDEDLPSHDRGAISALRETGDIDFLDVLTVFDDSTLHLGEGGWAIKPFAALASNFEEVILLDADAVFLQRPEVLFDQNTYMQHGAYLFHDRLLWQHAYTERHEWLRDQIKGPSPAMLKSLVWTEDYAEECDSGVVVVNKSRPEVLVGLLHVAWQSTYEVGREVTYAIKYGDKESWWLGLELARLGYGFKAHYRSMLGWSDNTTDETRVCSFVIAHVDASGRLVWYNGSLLKNKLAGPGGYEVPQF